MADSFYIIAKEGEGVYKEKMSKFLSFAFMIKNAEEAKAKIKEFQNKYHDARHVCWAYMIGADRDVWQLNDNGEPSGTAGKPILGQINSFGLTDVIVLVVRYFGGIKLGTPGLISAYKEAARLALEDAGKVQAHSMITFKILFPYSIANEVMKIIKTEQIEIKERSFDNTCSMTLSLRKDHAERIISRILNISGVTSAD